MIRIRPILPILLLLPAAALAADSAAATPPPPAGSTNLWDLIILGGWAMWPLGGCSLVMFYLLFLCWRDTRLSRFFPPQTGSDGEAAAAIERTAASPTVLGRALASAKPHLAKNSREDADAAVVETIEYEDHRIGQHINYLNVVATIAPMIGLLGTVSGMIGAFQTISAGGMGRPELLAGDIGEALITTAAGLIIGIPAMIAFFVLRTRLATALMDCVRMANDLMDSAGARATAQAGTNGSRRRKAERLKAEGPATRQRDNGPPAAGPKADGSDSTERQALAAMDPLV